MKLFFGAAAAAIAALDLTIAVTLQAQTGTPRKRVTPPRAASTRIVVRDQSGTPVQGAHVLASGAAAFGASTDANGTVILKPMRNGSYRLRLEREGFITLE